MVVPACAVADRDDDPDGLEEESQAPIPMSRTNTPAAPPQRPTSRILISSVKADVLRLPVASSPECLKGMATWSKSSKPFRGNES